MTGLGAMVIPHCCYYCKHFLLVTCELLVLVEALAFWFLLVGMVDHIALTEAYVSYMIMWRLMSEDFVVHHLSPQEVCWLYQLAARSIGDLTWLVLSLRMAVRGARGASTSSTKAWILASSLSSVFTELETSGLR